MLTKKIPFRHHWLEAAFCAVGGFLIFQFLGNSTRGYIGTSSLFYWWGYQWFNPQSETQHGILILALSTWLSVRNLNRRTGAGLESVSPSYAAAGAMLLGLFLHVMGFIAEQSRLSIIGLLFFTWGVLALGGGRRWALSTAFPVVFLVFAIPLSALDSTGFWLRMWVVHASGAILHIFSIPVLVNGTLLLSPDGRYNYDVAAACSGVRSLVAIAALSMLIGYLEFRKAWLWVATFAAAFPLILFGNVVRIIAIVLAAQVGGQEWGDKVHAFMGFAVFGIVLGGVFWLTGPVGRHFPDSLRSKAEGKDAPAADSGDNGGDSTRWTSGLVLGCMGLAALVLVHVSRHPGVSGAGVNLAEDGVNPVPLPTFVGAEWMGRRADVTEVERQTLPADTGYSRKTYVSLADPSKQVFLSIVLSGRDRSSIHRPEYCLVGQGWSIRDQFSHNFSRPGAKEIPATVLRVDKEVVAAGKPVRVPQLFAYYFVNLDSAVSNSWDRVVKDSWNRLFHGRSDRWAYVVAQTGSVDGEPAALARIQSILDGTVPGFQKAF